MESLLTPAQIRLRGEARAAAAEIVAPGAVGRDAAGEFPATEIRALAERGFLGTMLDPARGGQGRDATSALLAAIEISKACASTGLLVGFHTLVVGPLTAQRVRPEVGDSIVRALATGAMLGAVAMTDPPSTGAAFAPAQAFPEGDCVVLRGGKLFVPAAAGADLFLVYARWSDSAAGAGRRRALLLVPRGAPGVAIDPADSIFGVRAAGVASLRFCDCRVESTHLLGGVEDARTLAPAILAPASLAVAAQAVGIAEAIFEKILARASGREPSGATLGARQPIQWKLADMRVQLDASRLLALRAADAWDRGQPFAYEAYQAKVTAGRAAARIADEAIQVVGGSGAIQDGGVERHWRDAKTTELNPISREAAQLAIARHLLEEPR
jgi:butyryl-CoA dehydrogenase